VLEKKKNLDACVDEKTAPSSPDAGDAPREEEGRRGSAAGA